MLNKELLEAVRRYIEKYYIPEVEAVEADKENTVVLECVALLCGEENDEIFEDEGIAETEVLNRRKTKMFGAKSNSTVARRSIDDLMKQMEETFSQRLLRMITEKGMTDSEAYTKAYIDRRHFSKIRNDVNYSPNKKTVLAFAIALELSLDETKDLLSTAGFALSRSSKGDVIVSYFLENKIYDMFEINEILETYGQPVFG